MSVRVNYSCLNVRFLSICFRLPAILPEKWGMPPMSLIAANSIGIRKKITYSWVNVRFYELNRQPKRLRTQLPNIKVKVHDMTFSFHIRITGRHYADIYQYTIHYNIYVCFSSSPSPSLSHAIFSFCSFVFTKSFPEENIHCLFILLPAVFHVFQATVTDTVGFLYNQSRLDDERPVRSNMINNWERWLS